MVRVALSGDEGGGVGALCAWGWKGRGWKGRGGESWREMRGHGRWEVDGTSGMGEIYECTMVNKRVVR